MFLSLFCVISVRSGSHVSSSVSVKHNHGEVLNFRDKSPSSTKRYFVTYIYGVALSNFFTVVYQSKVFLTVRMFNSNNF